jgi:hypothetical protein
VLAEAYPSHRERKGWRVSELPIIESSLTIATRLLAETEAALAASESARERAEGEAERLRAAGEAVLPWMLGLRESIGDSDRRWTRKQASDLRAAVSVLRAALSPSTDVPPQEETSDG